MGVASPPPFFLRWRLVWVGSRPCWWQHFACCGELGAVGVALGFLLLLSTDGHCCLSGRGPLGPPNPLLPPPLFFPRSVSLPTVLAVSASPWSASFPSGVRVGMSGVFCPMARRWPGGRGSPPSLAWRCWAGRACLPVSCRWVPWSSPVVSPGWGGSPPRWSGYVASRFRGRPSCFPPFPSVCGFAPVGWRGLPLWLVPAVSCSYVGGISPPFPCCFFGGGFCLFPPLPSLGRRMQWSVNGVANWLFVLQCVAVFWVATGRAPAPCVPWLMYTYELTARPVGLGSGSAGWASWRQPVLWGQGSGGGWGWLRRFFGMGLRGVRPRLWCRFGVGGFYFPVGTCAGGPPLAWGGGCVPFFRRARWEGMHHWVHGERRPMARVVLRVWALVSVWWAGVVVSRAS